MDKARAMVSNGINVLSGTISPATLTQYVRDDDGIYGRSFGWERVFTHEMHNLPALGPSDEPPPYKIATPEFLFQQRDRRTIELTGKSLDQHARAGLRDVGSADPSPSPPPPPPPPPHDDGGDNNGDGDASANEEEDFGGAPPPSKWTPSISTSPAGGTRGEADCAGAGVVDCPVHVEQATLPDCEHTPDRVAGEVLLDKRHRPPDPRSTRQWGEDWRGRHACPVRALSTQPTVTRTRRLDAHQHIPTPARSI
jgi:hypothetical protein